MKNNEKKDIPNPFPKVNEDKQLTFCDVNPDWRKEWQDMPEFVMGDCEPVQRITINFASYEDVQEFGRLVGQKIGKRKDSLWFPAQNTVPTSDFRYVGTK